MLYAYAFSDETLSVYVALQTPHFDESAVRPYLDRLVITLEARIVNAPSEGQNTQPNHETIYSGSIDQVKDAPIVISSPGKDDSKGLLVLWRFEVLLSRPARLRLQSPSVVFAMAAHLKTSEQLQERIRQKEYLPSQVPSGINLLESFNSDPELGIIKPKLSALRVSAVKPATPGEDSNRPIQIKSQRPLRILPAFHVRTRYTRPTGTTSEPTILASLDVETTAWAGEYATLKSVNFDLSDGIVEDMNEVSGFTLPMKCLPRDDLTFLYRLFRSPLEQLPISQKALNISITATIHVSPTCNPTISMSWPTTVDFSQQLNPSAGFSHTTGALQRDRRPSQLLSTAPHHDPLSPAISLALTKPDALPNFDVQTKHTRSISVDGLGLSITFTGPSTPVKVGEHFTWSISVVNKSPQPRKLALVPIIHRKLASAHRPPTNRPLSTSYRPKSRDGADQVERDLAEAVLDENILHAALKAASLESAGMVSLSTDVRIGPLARDACQMAELKFVALKAGLQGLEAVRVVDLGTQEQHSADVRELPVVVVEGAEIGLDSNAELAMRGS